MPKLVEQSKPVMFAKEITNIAIKHGAKRINLSIETAFCGTIEISYQINIAPDSLQISKKTVFSEEFSLLIQSNHNKVLIGCIEKITAKNSIENISLKEEQKEIVLSGSNIEDIYFILDTLLSMVMYVDNLNSSLDIEITSHKEI